MFIARGILVDKKRILVFFIGLLAAVLFLEISLKLTGFLYKKNRMSAHEGVGKTRGSRYVILCLGNSYTFGVGAPRGQSYPDQLQRMFDKKLKGRGITVINKGVGAETTGELLSKLELNIENKKPDLILLQTGQANWGFYYKYSDYLKRTFGDRAFFRKAASSLNDFLNSSSVYRLFFNLYASLNNRSGIQMLGAFYPEGNVCGVFLNNSTRLEQGSLGKSAKRAEDAINCYKERIRKNPDASLNYSYIGQIYYLQNNYEEALRWFMKAVQMASSNNGRIKESSRNAVNYNYIAYVYLFQNNYPEALKWFMQEVQANPYDMENSGYQGIRNIAVQARVHQDQFYNEIQSFIRSFKNIDVDKGRNFLLLSDNEVNQWVESDIKEIVRIARQKGIKVILQDYPNVFPENKLLRKIAVELGVPFVENERVFQARIANGAAHTDLFEFGGGHCNANGYGLMAMNVYNKIMEERILGFVE